MDDYNYTYTYTSTSTGSSDLTGADVAAVLGVLLFVSLFALAIYIFSSIAMMKLFKKAGVEQWAAWVPFYNLWKLLEMGKFNGALVLLMLIPGIGSFIVAVISSIAAYRIGLNFNRSGAFVLLYIFLTPIWLAVLGFGKDKWKGGKVEG